MISNISMFLVKKSDPSVIIFMCKEYCPCDTEYYGKCQIEFLMGSLWEIRSSYFSTSALTLLGGLLINGMKLI